MSAKKKQNKSLKSLKAKIAEQPVTKRLMPTNSEPDAYAQNKLIEAFNSGRYAEAEKIAREISLGFPRFEYAQQIIAAVCLYQGRLQEALNALQIAQELSPHDAATHCNIGIILRNLGRLAEAERSCRQALAIKPDFAVAYNNLGIALNDLGRQTEAETRYRQALQLNCDYAEAHCNLGNTLRDRGKFSDAVDCYRRALQLDANFAETHSNLGIAFKDLGRLNAAESSYLCALVLKPNYAQAYYNLGIVCKDLARLNEAVVCYGRALEIKPDFTEAHLGLSHALTGLGDEAGAAAHREQGFRENAVVTWSYRGSGACLSLLVLCSASGGNIPLKHILDERIFQSKVIVTEYFNPATPLPPHQLVINIISDADLCRSGLDAADLLLAQTSAPVINPPAQIRPSGRLNNANRLGALAGVITPRSLLLPRAMLIEGAESLLAEHGVGFPLLLRSPGYHTGQHFVRIETPCALAQTIDSLPGQELLVMQMLDARNQQGDSHKYRIMFVDGKLYPLHLAISPHWKVHYFSAAMEEQPQHRLLEAAFLEDMPTALGAKAMAALENIGQVLGLDYGGIDFALDPDGNILLFEANATMRIKPPPTDPKWTYRRIAVERIIMAVQTMIIRRAATDLGLR